MPSTAYQTRRWVPLHSTSRCSSERRSLCGISSTLAPPAWASFAAVCMEWWAWWSRTSTSRLLISVGIVAMCPIDVEGVTITGRPNSSASSASATRYSGAEAYAREEENWVPWRSTASRTAAFIRGSVSRPRYEQDPKLTSRRPATVMERPSRTSSSMSLCSNPRRMPSEMTSSTAVRKSSAVATSCVPPLSSAEGEPRAQQHPGHEGEHPRACEGADQRRPASTREHGTRRYRCQGDREQRHQHPGTRDSDQGDDGEGDDEQAGEQQPGRAVAQQDRQRPLADERVALDVTQVVDHEDRHDEQPDGDGDDERQPGQGQ